MKISTAALSFLILAAALGSPTHGSEIQVSGDFGYHHPTDCCHFYAKKIPCRFIENYFETSDGCSLPGVIFVTRRGRLVCANPSERQVQECIMKLMPKT